MELEEISPVCYMDVAIVEIDIPVELSKTVYPVCLPEISFDPEHLAWEPVIVIGYGPHNDGTELNKASQKVYPEEFCSDKYSIEDASTDNAKLIKAELPNGFDDTIICSGNRRASEGTCRGDSGGPLLIDEYVDGSFTTIQNGVLHGSLQSCSNQKYPAIFSRLSHPDIHNWLFSNLFPLSASETQCQNISVVLINNVLEAHSRVQDTYQLSGLVNETASWISKYQAIWYVPELKDWAFGDLKDLGSKSGRIASIGDQGNESLPYEIPSNQFKYSDNVWRTPGGNDISVDCIDGKGILENNGENCWSECHQQEGRCNWCGTEGWCCKLNSIGNGCNGLFGGESNHQCKLKPVLQPCQNLIVGLKNGALDVLAPLEGSYQLSSEVSGKDSWTTSSYAIWYIPEYKDWAIGNLAQKGTTIRAIASRFVYDLDQPYDVEYWDYYHPGSRSWVKNGTATDVTVKCET